MKSCYACMVRVLDATPFGVIHRRRGRGWVNKKVCTIYKLCLNSFPESVDVKLFCEGSKFVRENFQGVPGH